MNPPVASRDETASFDRDSFSAINAAVILGTVGASTILIMPGLLGVIVEALNLTESQLGFVASVDIFTMAIVMGVAALAIAHVGWRTLSMVGLAILAAGNVASMFSESYSGILWARAIAGIGEGITVAVSFAALGSTRDPDRAFGIYLVFALLFSAVALFGLPYTMEWGGEGLVFSFLVGLCLLNMMFIPWLAPTGPASIVSESTTTPVSMAIVGLGLAMVTLFFIAQGAVWSYLERIGFSHEIDARTVGSALGLSALAGIVGAGIAVFLGNKYSRTIPITGGVIVQVISMILLIGSVTPVTFIISVMLFNFSWNLCQAYFSGIMSEIDPQGRVVVLMGAIQTIGVSVGPFAAALIIKPGNFESISYLGIVCVLLSLATTYIVLNLWKSHKQGISLLAQTT